MLIEDVGISGLSLVAAIASCGGKPCAGSSGAGGIRGGSGSCSHCVRQFVRCIANARISIGRNSTLTRVGTALVSKLEAQLASRKCK